MAGTVPNDLDRTRLNTVQPRMAKAEMDVNAVALSEDTVNDAEILSLIAVAIRRSDLKQDWLAKRAKVSPSQLSGALNGHGAFNVRWLWSWPAEFWNEFLPLLRARKEASDDARRQQRKERLIQAIELLIVEVA